MPLRYIAQICGTCPLVTMAWGALANAIRGTFNVPDFWPTTDRNLPVCAACQSGGFSVGIGWYHSSWTQRTLIQKMELPKPSSWRIPSHWFGLSTRIRWCQNSHPPVELQIDLDCPQKSDDVAISTPWNFNLTWTLHKDQMISKFQRPRNFTFELECPQGSNDIKSPEPVEFYIELECPQGSDDIQDNAQIRTPMELQTFR